MRYNLSHLLLPILGAILFVACEDDIYDIPGGNILRGGLPVVEIVTHEHETIDRDFLRNTQLTITDSQGGQDYSGICMIKGRGNTTWESYPKKPYQITFESNIGLLSYPPGETWVLLANYKDQTLMRNDLAMFLSSKMGHIDYTPRGCFVNFILNGQYRGIYQIVEHLEVDKQRIDVGEDGFLLEIDGKAHYDDVTFRINHINQPISIKYPEVMENDADYNYVKDFLLKAEEALFSDHFTDENTGYRHYIDMDSFVEWYLVNEISKNNDAAFYTSCFMHLKRNGKLQMGPIWDYDWAFGGYKKDKQGRTVANIPENFYIKYVEWYQRLFEDPLFVEKVKSRFNDYYSNRQQIYDHIDENYRLLVNYVVYDNMIWERVCDRDNSEEKVKAAYLKRTNNLKEWIEKRMQWMKANIDEL